MAGVGSVLRNSSALRVFSREIRRSFYLSSRTLKDRNEDGNWLPLKQEDATIAVHAGYDPKEHPNGPLVPPISLGTTFEQHSPGQFKVQFSTKMIGEIIERQRAKGLNNLTCQRPAETL